jgi:hypothetical protein
MKLLLFLLPFFASAQIFPDVVSLSTGRGTPGTYDVIWKVNNQLNFQLNGPWNSGLNFIDIVVQNYPGEGIHSLFVNFRLENWWSVDSHSNFTF